MSLIYCPECGHEISNTAVACPNCGRPVNGMPVTERIPVVERKVVVARPRREGVPTWAIGVMGVLGVLLVFLLIAFWSRSGEDEANRSIRVNANTSREPIASRQTVESAPSSTMSIPPEGGTVPPVTVPPSETTVGGSQISLPTKGNAVIQAKVVTRNNSQQPVRNQRFYLLDKDVESILVDAEIQPIEGQTLSSSLGLAAMYPDRYGDFQQRALRAIKSHIRYAGTTDAAGKAQLNGINPDSYYLFGVVKAGNGYAMWSSPVSIQAGENVLDLTPQQITEIDQTSGEE